MEGSPLATNPHSIPLTPHEAERAIYIDFEGRKAGVPSLLGVYYLEGRKKPDPKRPILRQYIVDPAMAEAANRVQLPGFHSYSNELRPLALVLADIVRRAENQ